MKQSNISLQGRSMIEMLGVLAIVGILSVGGISGFSKAMEKHKLNQFQEKYIYFVEDVRKYQKDWYRARVAAKYSAYQYPLADYIAKMQMLPDRWKQEGNYIYDDAGGRHYISSLSDERMEFQYRLNYDENSSNIDTHRFCLFLLTSTMQKIDGIKTVELWTVNTMHARTYGKESCDEEHQPCFYDMGFGEIYEFCTICSKKQTNCSVRSIF